MFLFLYLFSPVFCFRDTLTGIFSDNMLAKVRSADVCLSEQ